MEEAMQKGDYRVGRDGRMWTVPWQEHGPDGRRGLGPGELWLGTMTHIATDNEGHIIPEECEVKLLPGREFAGASTVSMLSLFFKDWQRDDT